MAIELKVPSVGESVTEVEIGGWLKAEGDPVAKDENVVVIESEKATVELPAPVSGRLTKILKQKGESAKVGEVIGEMQPVENAERPTERKPPSKGEPAKTETETETRRESPAEKPEDQKSTGGKTIQTTGGIVAPAQRLEETVRMSLWRRTIARRLVEAKQAAALLTTFNEIDMSGVAELRKNYGERFQKKYATKLGLMPFFVKAAVDALKQFPQMNAEMRGENVVYHNFCDIGIAVSTTKGLVVPVLRRAERLSFAEIEKAIADFAGRSQTNDLLPEELEGGTFTITNGGVFGSLLSTPIVNPPQSAILGLHAIQERPVARAGQVVIRPMMYVAVTYDHRMIDGREAVLFLRRIKETIENPARMLIEV
ncbi:MAG TPA: dihydrolipoyllysine-residue succinyltransferase [Verrucomicrobiae bacterium]|nr:dihydrolipoyllysine-residue succinyltransferase [Verrucomicrobiae bacterium]